MVSLRHTLYDGKVAYDFLTKKSILSDISLVILYKTLLAIRSVLLMDVMVMNICSTLV